MRDISVDMILLWNVFVIPIFYSRYSYDLQCNQYERQNWSQGQLEWDSAVEVTFISGAEADIQHGVSLLEILRITVFILGTSNQLKPLSTNIVITYYIKNKHRESESESHLLLSWHTFFHMDKALQIPRSSSPPCTLHLPHKFPME